MRITQVLRGSHFGELAYIRGLVTFRLSPFELKAFGGFLKCIPRTAYRVRASIFKVAPPFMVGWLVFNETEKKYNQMCRKNPADYVNDK